MVWIWFGYGLDMASIWFVYGGNMVAIWWQYGGVWLERCECGDVLMWECVNAGMCECVKV